MQDGVLSDHIVELGIFGKVHLTKDRQQACLVNLSRRPFQQQISKMTQHKIQKKQKPNLKPTKSIQIHQSQSTPTFVGWNIFCSSRVRLVDVPGFGAGGISAAAAAAAGAASASSRVGAARPTTVGMPEPLWAWKVRVGPQNRSCQKPNLD